MKSNKILFKWWKFWLYPQLIVGAYVENFKQHLLNELLRK